MNLLLNTDSYKASHYLQYPPHSEVVSSYVESRGGRFPYTVFFGLQAFIKEYLQTPITAGMIDEAEELLKAHGLPFHRAGWDIILNEYKGLLPLEIEAVPEGTVIPNSNVMLQVRNTDPRLCWLTNYMETAILRAIWYPTTVATQSFALRRLLGDALEVSAGTQAGVEFKLHDFGARGASSEETAALGGMAHLLSFVGTDNISALVAARKYYREPMAGFSIPAAEHSTMTAWGRAHEADAYQNMIDQFGGPGRIFAVVTDSYDIWEAIQKIWGGTLKKKVMHQGGTLVLRPDSGDPLTVVAQVIEELMRIFGHQVNAAGYRVLPDYVRVIQGDGVSYDSIHRIVLHLLEKKISIENLAFGMGAELLQKVNRDTQKFAMKASAIQIAGQWHDISKAPVTDPGKASKKGRMALVQDADGTFHTIAAGDLGSRNQLLRPVFRNGSLLIDEDFAAIRQRLQKK